MSLPLTFKLPEIRNREFDPNVREYLEDLTTELQSMYEQMAFNVNGSIRNYAETDGSQWTPTIAGSTSTGTITYSTQYGFSIRKGIYTTVHFQVSWTAIGGSTGNLILQLPYKVALSSGTPFVGSCFTNTLTFPAGCTAVSIYANPNSTNAFFRAYGSGITSSNISIQNSGSFAGTISYIGIEDE